MSRESTRDSNVIDLSKRRQAKDGSAEKARGNSNSTSHVAGAKAAVPRGAQTPVVDMTERRQAILSSERREVKRTILSEFIGGFILVPEKGLQKVAIYDISENGVAFDLDLGQGGMKEGEEVAMRVYLNQYTYFPFIVTIANIRALPNEGVTRHGCNFLKDTVNSEALFHFVKFIETVSASLRTDHGDVMVSNLK